VRQILAVEKNERENEKSPSKRRKRFSNLPNWEAAATPTPSAKSGWPRRQ